MKYCIAITSIVFLFLNTIQAQVKIGGTPGAPAASAILELDGGTSKGLLLPRMTKQNMMDIQSPATGLTIFATDEQAVYVRVAGLWEKQGPFTLPYAGVYDYELASSFRVQNNSPTGSGIGGVTTAGTGVYGESTTGKAIAGYALNLGGIAGLFQHLQNGTALSVPQGKTGIGTSSANALLHVNGNSFSGITMMIDDNDFFLSLRNAGIEKGFVQLITNDVIIGNNAGVNGRTIFHNGGAGRMFIDNAGEIGIGNPANGARLYVDALSTSSTAMVINDVDPTLQFQNSGVNKGVVQVVGDDLRLGINAANSSGNIVFRTKGVDHTKIDSAGHLHLGETSGITAVLNVRSTGTRYGLNLQGDYGSNYGPGILFYGASPTHTPFGSIQAVTGYMEITSNGTTDRGLKLRVGSAFPIEAMRINGSNGNITATQKLGIGTFSPATLFHLDGYNNGNYTEGEIARIQGFNPIMQFTNVTNNVGFIQAAGGDFKIGTNITNPADLIFRTYGADRVFIKNNGKFFIGGDLGFTSDYTLAVKGKIAGSEFVVKTVASWPDYVFADNYNLNTLEETEIFIKENKHLPNMPAAAVIEKEGYGIGEMQKKMVEKIEELTLHLIEANKEIKLLKKQMTTLQQ
ncbi:MAG: hypothetical protein V4717_12775 [Bacteroidota bacterium]